LVRSVVPVTAADWVAIISSIGTIVITVVTVLTKRDVAVVNRDVAAVHDLVNSRSKEQDQRIAQLIRAMKKAGVVVPRDKAV
jgi:hypothetical protein